MVQPDKTVLMDATPARSGSATQTFLRRQLWIWPLIAAAMLLFVGVWVRRSMEQAIRVEIAGNLRTIRDANAEALRAWAASMKSKAELLAGDEQVRHLVEGLLKRVVDQGASRATLTRAPEFSELRTHLKPAEEGRGFIGYAVLDTNLVTIAAAREEFVGLKSPSNYAEQLAACFAGQVVLTPPFTASGAVPDEAGVLRAGVPVMFAAAPIRSADDRVIAVLGLRILPEKDFTRILATARAGKSGETYCFNRNGLLLSASRFDDELKRLGLIPDTASAQSLLTLDLRDPLVDLSQGERPPKHRPDLPFIKPVNEALAGHEGLDAHGYRDYRGIAVVGAWMWMPDFDLGLITEIDVSEALAPMRAVRLGFWMLFGLLTLCSLGVFVLMRVAGRFHLQARLANLKAEQLGQYALDEEIGSGGFGTVFRAHHALMRRPVAVKVLSPVAGDMAAARFEREVQVTCQLTHPNTVAVYDYGKTADGLFYYAMEYLDGFSLDRLIRDHGPQPEGRIIYILRQVCASLTEAHAHGLVHRDIKPQNIFLTCRGGIPDFVKVLDFGLVKAGDKEGQLELTGANATLGTPLYMSPEAVRNPAAVDALSDIYALGSVGYLLLTGETVFNGLSVGEVLLKQVSAPPDPPSTRLQKPVSADFEAVLMQCIAKNPSDRPPGAAALSEALGRCSACVSWTEREAREWWKGRAPGGQQPLTSLTN
jgi:eukaryotic-like serine/threonine-protein kinase